MADPKTLLEAYQRLANAPEPERWGGMVDYDVPSQESVTVSRWLSSELPKRTDELSELVRNKAVDDSSRISALRAQVDHQLGAEDSFSIIADESESDDIRLFAFICGAKQVGPTDDICAWFASPPFQNHGVEFARVLRGFRNGRLNRIGRRSPNCRSPRCRSIRSCPWCAH